MKQVFQTDSTSRWTKFKWTIRLVLFVVAFLVAVFIAMLAMEGSPGFPFRRDYVGVITASKPFLQENGLSKKYKDFRYYFKEKKPHAHYVKEKARKMEHIKQYAGKGDAVTQKYIDSWGGQAAGIRSAFYVTWDPKSYISLKQNIGKLNLVVPEWYFIHPSTGQAEARIDSKAYNLMKRSGVPIMPILSNNYNQNFDSKSLAKLLHSKERRKALISSMLSECKKHGFVGINIDFEELGDVNEGYLLLFVKELSEVFHREGLYVTQDIAPFNDDYDVAALAEYVDYLFVMAYDEHNTLTEAGPISSQRWLVEAVDRVARNVPEEKLVLCMAAYAYDWTPKGDDNQVISYREALSIASDTGASILFDSDTYNLNFDYQDDKNSLHSVYFVDAATQFNIMRFGAEYGLGGFSVWRLGGEDSRLWQFFTNDMTDVGKIDITKMEHLSGSRDVNMLGTGEVLDVIDTPKPGYAEISINKEYGIIDGEEYKEIPSSYQLQKFGSARPNELLLTFDDGPDARWTPRVLEILRKYNIKAAFFMVGLQMEKNLPIVKDVAKEGHFIGNHTFTHHNIYENSPARTEMELKLTRLLIECTTGRSTLLFRAPYNADSDPAGMDEIVPILLARQQNYLDVGESIDPEDWEPGVTSRQIFQRVVKGVEQGNGHIILLHDAGGTTREETLKALPQIIEYLQKKGYTFISLDRYLGKTRDQLMPPIPKGKSYYAMQANLTLATIVYGVGDFLAALFIVFIVVGFLRLAFMWVLTIRERRKEKRRLGTACLPDRIPLVSIIVPAYNEEVNAVSSLSNLLKQDYPNFTIIFVDDGSKDATYQRVAEAFQDNPKVKILTKPNGGKASALNYGLANTEAQYVVCIDADTKLQHDAVRILMQHFFDDAGGKVGAVAGNVKVGNQCNVLTKWQAIEYTTSQNFDRQAYAAINAITVVPGAIGAFRKKAIVDAGGLTTDTLAEDCDLTMRILKAGYVVENENRAIALTEAPEKIRQFVKQRTRWCFGVMQTFWKHRGLLMNRKYKGLGLWALPNMLLFQFIIPTFSPIADLMMLFGLFSGNAGRIFLYYLVFTAVDASVSIMAYIFEKQRLSVLLWIIPQRFFYRWIMYFVLFKSYKKAIKGELQSWGILKRTGNVKDV